MKTQRAPIVPRERPSSGPAAVAPPIRVRYRIRVRLLVAFLTVTVSAVIVTTSAQHLLARGAMRSNVRERNLQIAAIAASKVTEFLRGSVSALAALGQIVRPITDPFVLDLILENSATIHRQFGGICVVDTAGSLIGSSALDNSSLTPPVGVIRKATRTGQLAVSEVRQSEDGKLSLDIAWPVAGRGILVAELLLRDVWDQMDEIAIGRSGRAVLLTAAGRLLSHEDKTRVLKRAADVQIRSVALRSSPLGLAEDRHADDGTPILVAAARVDEDLITADDPWYVAVVQDLADANVPLEQMLLTTALALTGFVLIALLTSYLFTGTFATPLARLLGGTERIRSGDLSHRIEIRTEDEIGRLSHSFNAMVRDLEERSRSLAGSEKRYRLLTESLTDLVFSLDTSGRIVYANQQSRRILGIEPRELEGRDALGLLTVAGQDGRAREEPYETTVTNAAGRVVVLEVRLVRADAPETGVAWYGVARDVTERKTAETRLKTYQEELRALALQLSLTEARERKRIAGEIHDRIGQTLALTRIKLGQLSSTSLSAEAAGMVKEAVPLVEQVIQDTRTLIFSVSSPLLYELGLAAALDQLVETFSLQHPIAFRYVEETRMPPLGTDTAVLLFDTVKELLVNVVKHANARNVTVTAAAPDGRLRIVVKDDGVGFDTSQGRGSGYGLFSVRERLESMRGALVINACPGEGTSITLEIPLA